MKKVIIYHCGDKNADDCSGNCKDCPHLGSIEIIDPEQLKNNNDKNN